MANVADDPDDAASVLRNLPYRGGSAQYRFASVCSQAPRRERARIERCDKIAAPTIQPHRRDVGGLTCGPGDGFAPSRSGPPSIWKDRLKSPRQRKHASSARRADAWDVCAYSSSR